MSLSEELETALITGEIWCNAWWLKPEWRRQIILCDNELKTRFSLLKDEFDYDWARSLGDNLGNHPLIQCLYFEESTANLRSLLDLAGHMQLLMNVEGFNRIIASYKTISSARSAELELFMAATLQSVGYKVSFISPKPKKGKTPDIVVIGKEIEFVVECKYLSSKDAEQWIKNYQFYYGRIIDNSVPEGMALYLKLYNPFVDIWNYGFPDKLTSFESAVNKDVKPILKAMQGLVKNQSFPSKRIIPTVGEIMMMHENEEIRSTIDIPELSHEFILNRLLRNGVKKANTQIKAFGKPGIASIFLSEALDRDFVKTEFEEIVRKDQDEFSLLMALLVFPQQNILQYAPPLLIVNEACEISIDETSIARDLDLLFSVIR